MRDIEIKLLDSFTKERQISYSDKKMLFSQPLGFATTEFLTTIQKKEIFKYDSMGEMWIQLELYFKESPENKDKMLQNIEQKLTESLNKTGAKNLEKSKKMGTYIMEVSPELIRQIYLSKNDSLISLFEKYVPTPPARFFEEKAVWIVDQ